MRIRDLKPEDARAIEVVAGMLVAEFREHWPDSWSTIEEARDEVQQSLQEERVSLIAEAENGEVWGWIAGQPSYSRVWELHPLVVRGEQQGQGVGRALVTALEERVREKGALTLMLGSDDEDNMTSLSGVDLYEDTWRHVQEIRNLRRHPYEFYQKLGYKIIGVVPDANGLGKPDILMAKRLGRGQKADG